MLSLCCDQSVLCASHSAGTAKHAEQGGEPSLQGKTEADDPNEQSEPGWT